MQGALGSIPGQGTKIPHAAQCSQKNKNIIKKINIAFKKSIRLVFQPCDYVMLVGKFYYC